VSSPADHQGFVGTGFYEGVDSYEQKVPFEVFAKASPRLGPSARFAGDSGSSGGGRRLVWSLCSSHVQRFVTADLYALESFSEACHLD
jgi:hypothetical protein